MGRWQELKGIGPVQMSQSQVQACGGIWVHSLGDPFVLSKGDSHRWYWDLRMPFVSLGVVEAPGKYGRNEACVVVVRVPPLLRACRVSCLSEGGIVDSGLWRLPAAPHSCLLHLEEDWSGHVGGSEW